MLAWTLSTSPQWPSKSLQSFQEAPRENLFALLLENSIRTHTFPFSSDCKWQSHGLAWCVITSRPGLAPINEPFKKYPSPTSILIEFCFWLTFKSSSWKDLFPPGTRWRCYQRTCSLEPLLHKGVTVQSADGAGCWLTDFPNSGMKRKKHSCAARWKTEKESRHYFLFCQPPLGSWQDSEIR